MRELVKHLVAVEDGANKYYVELACDSSESKPTADIVDGSIATETNTGDVYLFNEKTTAWVKQFSLQG